MGMEGGSGMVAGVIMLEFTHLPANGDVFSQLFRF
jgi:hypothetical protein